MKIITKLEHLTSISHFQLCMVNIDQPRAARVAMFCILTPGCLCISLMQTRTRAPVALTDPLDGDVK